MLAIMPIFWRHLLGQYLKYFLYCLMTFLAVLITTRLDEIAHFATMGPEGKLLLWYVFYQIPYILPIAIPLSSLISVMILMRNLSQSHELTALRASGFSIQFIIAPIIGASLIISLINIFITSEMTTHSHLSTNLLKKELRAVNPLLLLHNKHLMRVKGFYFDTLGQSKMGESASDIILAMPSNRNGRINLILGNHLTTASQQFYGKNLTLISSITAKNGNEQDRLIIENTSTAISSIKDFAKTVENKVWALNNDHLRFPLLLVKLSQAKESVVNNKQLVLPIQEQKQNIKTLNTCYSEILKRLSVGLAPFTFTLMGAAFGMSIDRKQSGRGIFFVTMLAALFLIGFFAAKNSHHLILNASLYYFVPHLLICSVSIWKIRRIVKGVE